MAKPRGGSAGSEAMREFWDRRASENALWYIDSSLDFKHPDETAFWEAGEEVLRGSVDHFGLALGPGMRVLEIGCGIGRVTRALAKRGAGVVGTDVSEQMIERGKTALQDLSNVTLMAGNGRDLSKFADHSFDAVFSFVTFQHIPDPEVTCNYIREMGRALVPGGWALFQVSQHPDWHRREFWRRRWLWGRWASVARLGRRPSRCLDPQWLGSTVDRARLLSALSAGDLELARIEGEGTLFCWVLARPRAAVQVGQGTTA